MIVAYGDVPWIDKVLSDTDLEALQAPRTPRAQVAQNMLEDLKYAEENIKPDGDGNNTINVHVVRALISRLGFMKEHGENIIIKKMQKLIFVFLRKLQPS